MAPIRLNINKQLRAIALPGSRIRCRSMPAALVLVIAMAAATMVWGNEANAAPQEGRLTGALETCAADANCSAPIQSEAVNAWLEVSPTTGDVLPAMRTNHDHPYAAAQEDDVDTPNIVVWSATMTVGESDIASIGYLGFITGDWPDTGSIDDASFSHDGVDYLVTALYHPIVTGNPNHLFLHLNMPLPEGWTLMVGQDVFAVSGAQVWGPRQNIYHWYLDASLGWSDGDQVQVSLSAPPSSEAFFEDALVQNLPPVIG